MSTNTLYILHIHKQPTDHEYISKRASQQLGETCFLNSGMPKKFHACPSINRSTKRHPRVTYYSPPLFPTIANHSSLHHNLGPQARLLGMRKKLHSTFSAPKVLCKFYEKCIFQQHALIYIIIFVKTSKKGFINRLLCHFLVLPLRLFEMLPLFVSNSVKR